VWDTSRFLAPGSALGDTAAVVLGYDPAPSLARVIAYVGYLAGMLLLVPGRVRRRIRQRGPASSL
jgi:hypothetical protein